MHECPLLTLKRAICVVKIRVGINGFGRIGRCLAKIVSASDRFELVAVNDIAQDVANLVYLYNYDSNYGRADVPAKVADAGMRIGGQYVRVYCAPSSGSVPWERSDVDVLIDSSGAASNIGTARELVEQGRVKKAIVTNSPQAGVDKILIVGINDSDYDPLEHHVVASSTCDANAIAHVFKALDERLCLRRGLVTTLHPWLSHQNLADGPLNANANSSGSNYALGRAATGTLIPKHTTAATAVVQACPQFAGKLDGFSYRVPTTIVTSADITAVVERQTSKEEVDEILEELVTDSPHVEINRESLVGDDYRKTACSVTIDGQWTRVLDGNIIKVIAWYDNEWGYCHRVVDLSAHLMSGAEERVRVRARVRAQRSALIL